MFTRPVCGMSPLAIGRSARNFGELEAGVLSAEFLGETLVPGDVALVLVSFVEGGLDGGVLGFMRGATNAAATAAAPTPASNNCRRLESRI